MKQKILSIMVVVGLVMLVVGCGGKYSDVVEVNQKYANLMTAFADDVDKVEKPADAAAAINKLTDGMEKLVPKMKALKKKYPELQDRENMTEELKATEQEMMDAGRAFGSSLMKLMPYMADEKVQQAQARLSTVMGSMGQE